MPSLAERLQQRLEDSPAQESGLEALLRRRTEKPSEEAMRFLAAEEPEGVTGLPRRAWQRLRETDVPQGKSPELEVARTSGIAAGSAVGSFAGLRTPIAPGPLGIAINPVTGSIVGGALGAGFGAIAPEFSLQVAESLGLIPYGTTKEYGRPLEERRRMALGEAALDAHFGILSNIPRFGGRTIARAMTGPQGPLRREEMQTLTGGPKPMTGQELAETALEKFGIELMPWQVARRGAASAFLTVAGRFPLIGAPAKKTPFFGRPLRYTTGQRKSEEQALQALHELPIKVGEVKEFPDLSSAILSDAQGLLGSFKDYFRREYETLWKLADQHGVSVDLANTRTKSREVVREMVSKAPKDAAGNPRLSETHRLLISYLENNVDNLSPIQSLKALDGLITNLDEFMTKIEPKQFRFVQAQINDLRNAALKDFTENLVPMPRTVAPTGLPTDITAAPGMAQHMGRVPPAGAPTMGATETYPGVFEVVTPELIASKIRRIDQEFSDVMTTLFETSTAKKFGRVERKGLRGMVWDPVTATPVGKLADMVLDLDDPKAISELFEIVSPQTRRDITASVLENGMARSWKEQSGAMGELGFKFDTKAFNEYFGLSESGTSARATTVKKMLDAAGSDITFEDVKLLGRTMDAIATTAQPSASSFIARRAQIGGSKAVIAGLAGGMVGTSAASSAAGYASGGMAGAALGMLVSFVGVRGLIRALSNPSGSRSLRNAIRPDAELGVIRANVLRLGRAAWNIWREDLRKDNAVDATKMSELNKMYDAFEEGLNKNLKMMEDSDTILKSRGGVDVPIR